VGPPLKARSALLRRTLAPLCLVLAVALLFHRVLLGEGVLFFRDICLNHLPTRLYDTPILRSGHLPLWNPYLSGGLPLAANPNNLIFHPVTLLFLILPVMPAFHASILLQYLLAGWGIYRWGRLENLGEEASLAGGLIFMLSGAMVSCGSLQNLLCSWAWVPVALWAAGSHRRSGSRKALVGFAGAVAVQLLAGDPLAAGTSLLVALLDTVLGEPRGNAGGRRDVAARLSASFLAGCCLAMVQILPAREMLSQSSRASGLSYADASTWSLPPIRLLELAAPSLYGDPTALKVTSYWGGLVFQKGYPFLLSVYLGAVPLLLSLCALAGKGDRRARALGGAALFFVLISLGPAGLLHRLIYNTVPLMSSLRYPSRFLLPACLCLSLLAALGLERLRREIPSARLGPAMRWLLAGAVPLSILMTILGLSSGAGWIAREGLGLPGSVGPAALESITGSLRGSFLRCGLLSAGLAAMILLVRRVRLGAGLASVLILLGIGGDLISANSHVNPVVPPAFYDVRPPVLNMLRPTDTGNRVYSDPRPPGFAVMAQSDSAWWGYYWDQVSARVATALPYGIWMAFDKSTDLLSPRRVNELSDGMRDLEPGKVGRLSEVASVGVLMSYREMEDPALIPAGSVARQTNVPLRFYRTRDPLPRAYLVGRARPESGEPLAALTGPGFDPRTEVYLAGISRPEGEAGETGRVRILESRAEEIEVEVSAHRPGWLVLTDNDYPGWIARVDGKSVPIQRGNFLFRAVRVPAGDLRVVFRYRPLALTLGGAVSLAALVLSIAWGWAPRKEPG
jgi:membrane protein YfhO